MARLIHVRRWLANMPTRSASLVPHQCPASLAAVVERVEGGLSWQAMYSQVSPHGLFVSLLVSNRWPRFQGNCIHATPRVRTQQKLKEDHSNCCCKKAYSVQEAAQSVGIGVTTLRDERRDGHLIVTYIGTKHTKPIVRSADLDRWLDAQPIDK